MSQTFCGLMGVLWYVWMFGRYENSLKLLQWETEIMKLKGNIIFTAFLYRVCLLFVLQAYILLPFTDILLVSRS